LLNRFFNGFLYSLRFSVFTHIPSHEEQGEEDPHEHVLCVSLGRVEKG
jgi:hypothetical protein